MSPDQLRQYSVELRTLAKSPQSLGKKLRAEASGKDEDESAGVGSDGILLAAKPARKGGKKKTSTVVEPEQSYEDMMKELGG